jgi:hypothetical protein
MSFRCTGLAGVISLMILGCATPLEMTETPESEQGKRQEQWVSGDRPIGEVGLMGAGSTLGTPNRGTIRDDLYPRDPRYPAGNQPWGSAFE